MTQPVIIAALITGTFQLITLLVTIWLKVDQGKLHTMVNSQQSILNQIARADALKAGIEQGKAEGVESERVRASALPKEK